MIDHVEGYELGRVLGRGGSGTVYEARQGSTGRAVAVKVLEVDATDAEVDRRFARERSTMSTLADHPGIVSILDAGVEDRRPWIAMDLCPAGSLARVERPLPVPEVLAVLHAVATALAAAHAVGVLHCDVKPANILLTGFARPVLSDFGIARLSAGSTRGSTVGGYTLDHVAPEVLGGRRPEPRSDVFSLGTTAWHLLAGRPPFRRPEDRSVAVVMRRIEQEPIPALPRSDTPPAVVALLRAMTVKSPTARPTAAEVARRVEGIARATGVALGAPLQQTATVLERTADSAAAATGVTAAGTGRRTGRATDHRPDLAHLTHAGRSAARAATPPSVERETGRSRRDPVVVTAIVAVLAVVLGLGGLTTWRLLPVSVAAGSALVTPAPSAAPSSPAASTDIPVALAGGSPADGGEGPVGGTDSGILGTGRAGGRGTGATSSADTPVGTRGDPAGSAGGPSAIPPTTPSGAQGPWEIHVVHRCTRSADDACSLSAPISIRLTVTNADGVPFTQGYCSDRYQVVAADGGMVSKREGTCNRGWITLDSAVLSPGTYTTRGNANPAEQWLGSVTDTFTVAP